MSAAAIKLATSAPPGSHSPGVGRFPWVAAGHRHGPDPLFDQDLANSDIAAVLPTRGAIIPEWLLVVPRVEALSVAEMAPHGRRASIGLAREIGHRVEKVTGASVIFEHGAGRTGSASACGVDQAHLHVVGLGSEFVQFVLGSESDRLEWMQTEPDDPWRQLPKQADYLLIIHKDRAWTAINPFPISQFMRRRVAHFVGLPEEWDYRCYPHIGNAQRTKAIFQFS